MAPGTGAILGSAGATGAAALSAAALRALSRALSLARRAAICCAISGEIPSSSAI